MEKNIQLEMTFEKPSNRFRENMENGVFTVFFEVDTPPRTEDISAASSFLKSMEDAVIRNNKFETGLAITDKIRSLDSHDPADFANGLNPGSKSKTIMFISGKGLRREQIQDKLGRCKSSGFSNIAAVTGDLTSEISLKNSKASQLKYTESVHITSHINELKDESLYQGAVVNPFIYTPSAIYPQYYKLVKKIKRGANFIIAQAGWDMVKIQELKWFLESRELHPPVISRMFFLTPELAQDIVAGKRPGIYISHDMGETLKRESKYGFSQFASAQWRRIQIQAAGAKLMGCSGVLISALERPEHVQTVCQKIQEGIDEFKSFDDWKQAYMSYLSRADMAPYPKRFYLFENLFTRQHPEIKVSAQVKECECRRKEKLNYKICKIMFKNANMKFAGEHFLAKKLLTGCRGCTYCRLPLMQFVCPEICPKGLANGPCGGTKIDGTCEGSNAECIHSKRFRLALLKNELDTLEEKFIRPAI